MAINPSTLYTGKIDNSDLANYPYGKAQDITTPGDSTGTPWVATLVNDIFGFQQALLSIASVVPSGTPETITASQYLESLQKISGRELFNTPGAATFNTPTWVKRIKVTLTGAGGGGGAGTNGGGSGGGGGATEIYYIDDPDPSYAIVIGTGGAGGVGSDGGNGSVTTFDILGALGGLGGKNDREDGGGIGVPASNGVLNFQGGDGEMASLNDLGNTGARGGRGGITYWGPGNGGAGDGDISGGGGLNPGSGGGGSSASGVPGGDGANGLVYVEWGIV